MVGMHRSTQHSIDTLTDITLSLGSTLTDVKYDTKYSKESDFTWDIRLEDTLRVRTECSLLLTPRVIYQMGIYFIAVRIDIQNLVSPRSTTYPAFNR